MPAATSSIQVKQRTCSPSPMMGSTSALSSTMCLMKSAKTWLTPCSPSAFSWGVMMLKGRQIE